MARTNRMLKFKSATGKGIGMGAQSVSARVRARTGVKTNKRGEDAEGRIGSLIKSFRPSAIGWRRP